MSEQVFSAALVVIAAAAIAWQLGKAQAAQPKYDAIPVRVRD